MKKGIIIILVLLLLSSIVVILNLKPKKLERTINGITTSARIYDGGLYLYEENGFKETFVKGVNIGATLPGYFPGELGINKETYLRWFHQISEMHANTIRVYTTMKPAFYEALYEFNQTSQNKLYVMHGVWLNEDLIKEIKDPYGQDNLLINEFIKDATDLVDIFHGNKTLEPRPGFASGVYTKDVSDYIISWVLGIEWDPEFVMTTNALNNEDTVYDGNYLYTQNASPFEVFLAKVGDAVLSYEALTYKETRPLSYTNWLTTDPLTHINEPDPKEDMVSVNVEHIRLKDKAFAGQFASYHVYPYYPEFMNHSESLKDEYDPINTYKAYLKKLNKFHKMPVLVAEFGVPASRGKAHDAKYSGFNQGGHTEKAQGEILASMLKDIKETNSMGALIFAWQDEWFKRTWNTMDFDLSWQRPFWSNVETNEQMFGLLSFEPGDQLKVLLDGNTSEWKDIAYIGNNLKVTQDERYLYLLIEKEEANEPLYIGIDTIPNQGNLSVVDPNIQFSRGADFLVSFNEQPRIQVDPYYDPFSHLYAEVLDMIEKPLGIDTINGGNFINRYHALSNALSIPNTFEHIPFSKYEAGLLTEGISDPNDPLYNSLADYYETDQVIELRIPYLLLNIMDPSTKVRMANFKGKFVFEGEKFEEIYIGVGSESRTVLLSPYTWNNWHMPTYHERLKQSYYIVKEVFKAYR